MLYQNVVKRPVAYNDFPMSASRPADTALGPKHFADGPTKEGKSLTDM